MAFGPQSDLAQFQSITTKLNHLTVATETTSGILNRHLEVIKQFCYENKLFLFIRPTETASTRLIKYGYATKSLDIHDKSANGGLAKGFIPVDAAFSKNGKTLKLQPSPNLDIEKKQLQLHGQAKITTLFISDALLNEYAQDQGLSEIFCHSKQTTTEQRFFIAQDNSPDHIIYMAERAISNHHNQITEHHNSWDIYWFQQPNHTEVETLLSQTDFLNQNQPTPLYVYAYENEEGHKIPVTGDYDLACIIPDKDYLLSDGTHASMQDDHGGSVSSGYGDFIISQLNQACSHTVFRHGAETQNIAFAQPIDERLICITPSRFAYVMPKESMAEASYDLVCRRKIIKWNPAYDRNHLPLSGKYFGIIDPKVKEKHQDLYNKLELLIKDLRILYRDLGIKHLHDIHGFSLKGAKNNPNQDNNFELTLNLKVQLQAFLASYQESEDVTIIGNIKAEQLVGQLTDILLYQERLKVYLSLAGQEDAPQSFFCFDYQDFSEDKNSLFIENALDRDLWIKTIEQVVDKTGNENFEPKQPPRISTTDDIADTMRVLEKNETIFDLANPNRRRSSAMSILSNLTNLEKVHTNTESDNHHTTSYHYR